MAGGPSMWMAFSGGGNPMIKTKPRWWEDPTFLKVEQDASFVEKDVNCQTKAYEKIMRYRGAFGDEDIPEYKFGFNGSRFNS